VTEYWEDVISDIKKRHPGFLFIAEAYWDMEWELQQLGFDFCYDKKLYDRLEHSNAEDITLHLFADLAYQNKLLRFLENHDEPRAAGTFAPAKERAAALIAATLPGTRLFHEGQFEGRELRLPVFLGRRPDEPLKQDLANFYAKLLGAINNPVFLEGEWRLCDRTGWPDNPTFQDVLAWSWLYGDARYLVVVNFSDNRSQAMIHKSGLSLGGRTWQLVDVLSGVTYERYGDEMNSSGLFVDLLAWNYHFFRFQPLN